jgi:hypothetical protein
MCSQSGQPYQGDDILRFHYANPIITAVNPANGPNTGATQITVQGVNFGGYYGYIPTVTIGGVDCPVNVTAGYNNTFLVCSLPAGEGRGKSVVVAATAIISHYSDPYPFNYDPPVISSITPSTCEPLRR